MMLPTADKNTEKWHLLELQDALDGVMESRFCVGGEWQLEQPVVVTCHNQKSVSNDATVPKIVQSLQFPMSAQDSKQLDHHPFIRSLHAPRAALESQFKSSLPASCFDVNIDLAMSSSAPASSSTASSSGTYRHFSSSILQRIHTSLVPEAHLLRAELQHMSWRNPGFKQSTFAHQTRESLKNQLANPHNTFVGVLELVLPSPFQGGALRIRHHQREKQFLYPAFDPTQDTATGASHFIPRNCIAWTAFFGEACFCVSPIVEDETQNDGGSRVSLIYFLFRESHPPPDPFVDHLLLRVHMLQEQLRQALQSPNFFPAGGRLHLRMRHLYDERHIAVTEEKMLVCFRESSGPVSIQGRFKACNICTDFKFVRTPRLVSNSCCRDSVGIRLKDEDAVLAVIFSAFHLDVSISRLLEIEVDENSRRQQRVRCKEKGESFQDPLDDDTLWILSSLPRTSNSRSITRKNNLNNRKEEDRKVFGKLRRASHGGYSLMSVTHAEINAFASHEIKRSEHTWIGTYAIPHKWFADRAYGEVIAVDVPSDIHPSGKVEMIAESALDASFLTSTSFCVHIPPADKRSSIVNLGAPALSSVLIRRKKARKNKKKKPENVQKRGLPRRGRLQMSLGNSKPCVQASAVRAPTISGASVPTVDANLHNAAATFPMESLVAEAAKHAKAFPKASKTTSLPTGVFSSSHHGIKLTENEAQRYCVRISIGAGMFAFDFLSCWM